MSYLNLLNDAMHIAADLKPLPDWKSKESVDAWIIKITPDLTQLVFDYVNNARVSAIAHAPMACPEGIAPETWTKIFNFVSALIPLILNLIKG